MAPIKQRQLDRLFVEVRQVIAFDQPKLSATISENGVSVSGTFILSSTVEEIAEQGTIAEYEVCIFFPVSFPNGEPVVFETGNVIPRDHDYHVNDDGTCCIVIWEALATSTKNVTIQLYFDGPLKNFFLSQHQKALTGKWPFDEERHGKQGLIEAFANRLSCGRNEETVRYLLRVLSRDWPRGHWGCPCGSGRKIRKCCGERLSRLSKEVPKLDARRMLWRLKTSGRTSSI